MIRGSEAFARHEPRDAMYRVATFLDDDPIIRGLFGEFLVALVIANGKSKGKRSPVAVAKALHLLAPDFFSLWDKNIALACGCDYSVMASDKYISFMKLSQTIVRNLHSRIVPPVGKTLLKLIDEYSYTKYTKGWIE